MLSHSSHGNQRVTDVEVPGLQHASAMPWPMPQRWGYESPPNRAPYFTLQLNGFTISKLGHSGDPQCRRGTDFWVRSHGEADGGAEHGGEPWWLDGGEMLGE